jgi:hypothetical protein
MSHLGRIFLKIKLENLVVCFKIYYFLMTFVRFLVSKDSKNGNNLHALGNDMFLGFPHYAHLYMRCRKV